MGNAVISGEIEHQSTNPPKAGAPVREFAELAENGVSETRRDRQSLNVVAWPTSMDEKKATAPVVGPYNPLSLAGRALSLSASLSPEYLQTYLTGLEDLSTLRRLPEPSKRRRK